VLLYLLLFFVAVSAYFNVAPFIAAVFGVAPFCWLPHATWLLLLRLLLVVVYVLIVMPQFNTIRRCKKVADKITSNINT